jgi:hypothetical protein
MAASFAISEVGGKWRSDSARNLSIENSSLFIGDNLLISFVLLPLISE